MSKARASHMDADSKAPSHWTPERVQVLTRLWDEGLTLTAIASTMGGLNKNQVVGKVHRLNLPPRIKGVRKDGRVWLRGNQGTVSPVPSSSVASAEASQEDGRTGVQAQDDGPLVRGNLLSLGATHASHPQVTTVSEDREDMSALNYQVESVPVSEAQLVSTVEAVQAEPAVEAVTEVEVEVEPEVAQAEPVATVEAIQAEPAAEANVEPVATEEAGAVVQPEILKGAKPEVMRSDPDNGRAPYKPQFSPAKHGVELEGPKAEFPTRVDAMFPNVGGSIGSAVASLRSGHCKWPIGDPKDPDFRFCLKNKEGGKGAYCEDHSKMAYIPPMARIRVRAA